MTTPFPFVSGTVLTAQALNDITNLPINDQTASYTLVVGDAGKRVVMNVASANTVTVDDSIFAVGDTIFISSKGAGATTVTAGSGVTINTAGSLVIAQHGGGTLVATSASVFTFFPSGGVANPSTAEFLVIAGGGGGGSGAGGAGGGGGAGGYRNSVSGESQGGLGVLDTPFSVAGGVTYTVTVGGGGASNTSGTASSIAGSNITTITSTGGGRGGGNSTNPATGGSGGGGGGQSGFRTGAAGTANEGFAGGTTADTSGAGGGGAGEAGNTDGVRQGGDGLSSSITGTAVTRGGGGGAARRGAAEQNGGDGGGGNGGLDSAAGSPGVVNTGGGGGGGDAASGGFAGGAGGKGVVIIRTAIGNAYPTTVTGASVTATATHFVFTFNDSGTIGWAA